MSTLSTTIIRYQDVNTKIQYDEEQYQARLAAGCNDNEFDEIEIDVEVEFHGEWANVGIGAFEWQGFKGYDKQMEYLVEELESVKDKDGKEWKDELCESEYEYLRNQCIEQGREEFD